MIITNVATFDQNINGTYPVYSFNLKTPPTTRPYKFEIFSMTISEYDGGIYSVNMGSKTFQNNPGLITQASAKPDNRKTNALTYYEIMFKLTNKMPYCIVLGSKVCKGFINIVFPSSLMIDGSASCDDNVT